MKFVRMANDKSNGHISLSMNVHVDLNGMFKDEDIFKYLDSHFTVDEGITKK